MLQGPGENAGVVDLGEGLACAFKVESHNHPSAVEPFQGAATGVGGILRDIIAMGARPVALLDGLRFGADDFSFDRAVGGIGHYGNCVGVPTVGGEAVFDDAYRHNPLVNAMCVGLLPAERVTRASATGPGNLVVLYGATTGRDGIGGASVLASQELSDEDEDKRPTVQIGDPFTGKKLIEASLELTEGGLVESLQDLGAAGLASSLAEMAGRGGAGVDVHLDRVPLREPDLAPVEIMVSESQERMVAVVAPERARGRRGGLPQVGARLRGDRRGHRLRASCARTSTARRSARSRSPSSRTRRRATRGDGAARAARRRSSHEPARVGARRAARPARDRRTSAAAAPCSSATTTSSARAPFAGPGLDAAVLRLRPSLRGLAVSLDGPGRAAALDPRTAGARAVFEAARNVACAGGRPLAITDCLNFGNPEKPEIAWELAEAIEGMAQACEALGMPVVSGNVSLYNETDGRAIPPTPVVGCVGLVADVRSVPGAWREGDVVLVAGGDPLALDGSEYQALFLGGPAGRPPPPDYARRGGARRASSGARRRVLARRARRLGRRPRGRARRAGAPFRDRRGARARARGRSHGSARAPARAVVACAPERVEALEGVPLRRLGIVGGEKLLGVPLEDLREAYEGGAG